MANRDLQIKDNNLTCVAACQLSVMHVKVSCNTSRGIHPLASGRETQPFNAEVMYKRSGSDRTVVRVEWKVTQASFIAKNRFHVPF